MLIPVPPEEKEVFLEMAHQHFSELNPDFIPQDDWKINYFESISSNPNRSMRWIIMRKERIGFIIFGIEKHRFLPRKIGKIYELFVLPTYRRRGIGIECARQAIEELQTQKVVKIELEVWEGNNKAAALWQKLGFSKVAERFVMQSGN